MIKKHSDDYWIPLADLMTGMMFIFLLIAVVLISQVTHKVREQQTIKQELYKELYQEFYPNLQKWHANINESDLSIKFMQPEILFDVGKNTLKPDFKIILDDFFPRYIRILTRQKYLIKIREVRIEGHTSSIWRGVTDPDQAYFLNMELSEARSRETLKYLYFLTTDKIVHSNLSANAYKRFLQLYVMVSGLSSSHLVRDKYGKENEYLSQRVEFKIGL